MDLVFHANQNYNYCALWWANSYLHKKSLKAKARDGSWDTSFPVYKT